MRYIYKFLKLILLSFKKLIILILKYLSKIFKIFPDDLEFKSSIVFNNIRIFFYSSNLVSYLRWTRFQKDGKEANTINFIDNFETNSVFFDIGANVGVFSLYAYLKNKNQVYSFEPEVNSFINLIKTIKSNNADIVPLLMPIDITSNTNHFNYNFKDKIESGISGHNFGKKKENSFSYLTTSEKLDNLVINNNIPYPNYIKMDVDGNEFLILNGMKKILGNSALKSILIEIDNINEKNKIVSILEEYNFILTKDSSINKNYIFKKNGSGGGI